MRRSIWLWLLLAVLVVLLLGLLFGGYRKGAVVNAPSPTSPVPSHTVVYE
ncbi:hypothetical protein [Kutzneria buriramensis]|uniref:Uncharacterized protein n=1 Tax=Kutzneria buriramensis TaxID=1045776 RepID=A0A3E0HKM4_9PSEU|nr:hypothetical protein [Kutzneria buriramensis]REH46967.1 hypothetical protein BCF44_106131 [Kutzneria buriramensis]